MTAAIRPPAQLNTSNALLLLLVIFEVALTVCVLKLGPNADLLRVGSVAQNVLFGLMYLNVGAGVAYFLGCVVDKTTVPSRSLTIMTVIGVLLAVSLNAVTIQDRAALRFTLNTLAALPATLPYRAVTTGGTFRGALTQKGLICGTILPTSGSQTGFTVILAQTGIPGRPDDVAPATGILPVNEMIVDPAASQLIKAVPDRLRQAVWQQENCPPSRDGMTQPVLLHPSVIGTHALAK